MLGADGARTSRRRPEPEQAMIAEMASNVDVVRSYQDEVVGRLVRGERSTKEAAP